MPYKAALERIKSISFGNKQMDMVILDLFRDAWEQRIRDLESDMQAIKWLLEEFSMKAVEQLVSQVIN